MWYVKNVPGWERVVRVIAGLAVASWAMLSLGGTLGWVIALASAGIVLSGLIGFCTACALAGRRIQKRLKENAGA